MPVTIHAPPDRDGVVLNSNDFLIVDFGGIANGTTINAGGAEVVREGGIANDTTINDRGGEQITLGGVSNRTTINDGGTEVITAGGIANGTVINAGGQEVIGAYGVSNDPTINSGGTELVEARGIAHNVTFGSVGGVLELAAPQFALSGTLNNWHVGDVVDLLNTRVTEVAQEGNLLWVVYHNGVAIYTLVGQQADTHVTYHSDGHGGTDLVLTPVVGIPHHHDEDHHFGV